MPHPAPTPLDWSLLLADFAEARAEPVEHEPDGSWRVEVICGLASPTALLARAPVPFTTHERSRDPMYDDFGADVEDETTSGVEASDDARAIFTWADHWQAGLCATLAVYATEARYRAALEAVLEGIEGEDEDDDDERTAARA